MNIYSLNTRRHSVFNRCCSIVLLISAMGASGVLRAQAQPLGAAAEAASAELEDWSPFINGTTILVAKLDTGRLTVPELAEAFHGETVWVAVDIPYSPSQPVVRLYSKRPATSKLKNLASKLQALHLSEPQREGEFLRYSLSMFASPDPTATIEDRFLAHSRDGLPAAIGAAGEAPLQCLIMPPQYLRDTIRDLLPTIPAEFGGGPSSVLTEGFLWAAFSFDPAQAEARLEIQSASDEAARRLAVHLRVFAARLVSEMPWASEGVPSAQQSKPEVAGDRIIIELGVAPVVGVLQAAAQRVTRHIDRLGKQTQLKQIALAIHNFENRHGSFPPHAEVRDGQGKPRLSWRVQLLPYLDEAELYAQFRLDEPWDSDHNLPLLQKMPAAFASPLAPAGHTQLLAPVGERTIFGGADPVKFQHVIDGLSNTVMVVVVVAERAVPWTAPEDFVFDPEQPGDGLARDAEGRIQVVTADGAYHGLASDLPADVLLNLFQMNDGNTVRW